MLEDSDLDLTVCQALVFDKSMFAYADVISDEMIASGLQCPNPSTCIDTVGFSWCDNCEYRGDFLGWGLAHGFPALQVKENGKVVYAIAEGVYYWGVTAMYATQDRILALIVAAEDQQLEKAS